MRANPRFFRVQITGLKPHLAVQRKDGSYRSFCGRKFSRLGLLVSEVTCYDGDECRRCHYCAKKTRPVLWVPNPMGGRRDAAPVAPSTPAVREMCRYLRAELTAIEISAAGN